VSICYSSKGGTLNVSLTAVPKVLKLACFAVLSVSQIMYCWW